MEYARRTRRNVRRQRCLRWLSSGRSETVAWLAAQACDGSRDRPVGARRLCRRDLRLLRSEIAFFPPGRQIPRRNRRAGRQAGRLRSEVHVRCRSAAAISGRIPRWTPQALSLAWDSRPRKKAASTGFISIPTRRSSTTTSCTGRSSIRTGISCAPNAIRPACGRITMRRRTDSTPLCRDQRGLRGLSRPRLSPRCLGARPEGWWPFGKREDKSEGLAVHFDERSDVTWRHDPKAGDPQRSVAPPVLRKEVETCGLCHARRAEFSEDWVPGRELSDTHVVAGLGHGLYFADGQMAARSTITARSSRARCSQRVSPAAIAMTRTAAS